MGSRLTKTNFVFGLVSLDSEENFFCAVFIFLFPAKLCFSYLFNASSYLYAPINVIPEGGGGGRGGGGGFETAGKPPLGNFKKL